MSALPTWVSITDINNPSVGSLSLALDAACRQLTFRAGLAYILMWENDRAVRQAVRRAIVHEPPGPDGQHWDTCFGHVLREFMSEWEKIRGLKAEDVLSLRRTAATEEDVHGFEP